MTVSIRTARPEDRAEWLRMRLALWDDCPVEQQLFEMDGIRRSDSDVVFLAERLEGGLCGFLEAAVRSRANGCDSTPVGYVEGWFVDPDMRRQGIGKALTEVAEDWARSKGCREMASDAELWNVLSHDAHRSLGYEETGRLVLFKKDLKR